jgi:hypothetical protein
MPSSPWFVRSSFSLTRAIGATSSPFTGKFRTQEYDAVYWSGSVSLPPMNRAQAAEWQAFLLELKGTTNYFKFVDPDGKTPQGTYDGSVLLGDIRVNSGTNVTSATLSFSGTTITAVASGTPFSGVSTNDYITVSGATNEANAGTFKILTKLSSTAVTVDANLTTEASVTGCKIRQNVKGSTALSLETNGNTSTGTIKKGDYLAVYDGASSTVSNPIQLVMVTADAVETNNVGAKNFYSVAIQPKLRQDLADNHVVGFSTSFNRSRFRLAQNSVDWDSNHVSTYGVSFDFIEVS